MMEELRRRAVLLEERRLRYKLPPGGFWYFNAHVLAVHTLREMIEEIAETLKIPREFVRVSIVDDVPRVDLGFPPDPKLQDKRYREMLTTHARGIVEAATDRYHARLQERREGLGYG